MCIFVICNCSGWDGNQQQDLGKPSQEKIAKPSYRWEAAERPIPCGECKDSVCFKKRAKMDSIAAVLPMPGFSSMYKAECDSISRTDA
jgi:hypothetical protein